MRRCSLLSLFVFCLLAVGGVAAQDDLAASLGIYIDTHVELQGFPTTGSQIEAARQAVAQNIDREINHVIEAVGGLESTSVGREYIEAVDAAVDGSTPLTSAQQFLQTRPRNDPFSDNRPAVPQHDGIDAEITRQINDALRDLFRSDDGGELPTYQYTERPHQQTRLDELMQRYGREIAAMQGELALNEQEQRLLAEAVADGASDAIDAANPTHRNLVKRIIRRYVQVMTASQELPIAGYWRVPPVEYSRSGACEIYTGDNGGMAPITEEEWPTYPLCGYDPGDALPFLVWQGHEAPYIPGTSSIYSPTSTVEIQVARSGSGATLRSVRTTHAVEYEVVAPDRIVVRESFIEEGGCSLYAEYTIELARQDETVCNLTEIPPEPDAEPDPTVPPGESRVMQVGSPWYQDEAACDASNTPPDMDTMTLTANADHSLTLDYGSGTKTLYSSGWGYYEYSTGTNTPREHIQLNLYDGGRAGHLNWSLRSASTGQDCHASRALGLPDAADFDTPLDAPTDDPQTGDPLETTGDEAAFGAVFPGEYSAEWIVMDGLCPADLLPFAPQFETATLSEPETGAVALQFGDSALRFALIAAGTYMGSAPTDNGRIDTSLTTATPGQASFAWTWSTGDGQMCMVMATLTKRDG